MTIKKFTESEISKYHVQRMSGNRLKGTADENKKVFDDFPQFIADRINSIITELTGSGGASNISTTAGTLQDVLDNYQAGLNNRYTIEAADTKIATETLSLVKNVEVDLKTGVIRVTKKDGTYQDIDTALEKVPAKFELQENDQAGTAILVVTNQDGSTTSTDISNLLNHYSFENTSGIQFTATKQADGYHVTAIIPDASITMAKLNAEVTDYFNKLKEAVSANMQTTETNKTAAAESAAKAKDSSTLSESWAVGGTNTRTNEDYDNSKFYSESAKEYRDEAKTASEYSGQQEQKCEEIYARLESVADFSSAKEIADNMGEWSADEVSDIVDEAWGGQSDTSDNAKAFSSMEVSEIAKKGWS